MRTSPETPQKAFTLPELLMVVSLVALLALVAFPAMARAKTKNFNAGCLNNLRQMMNGFVMYADENRDYLMPNNPGGATSSGWSGTSTESWSNITNTAPLTNGLMYPYLANDISVFRCPADLVPSSNGSRLRSYSMNGQVAPGISSENPGWRKYQSKADLTCPGPANTFVLCDESPVSINDGFIQCNLPIPDYPDLPAAYMDSGAGFGFADGHAEIHRWVSSTLLVPIVPGVIMHHVSGNNADYTWYSSRCACAN